MKAIEAMAAMAAAVSNDSAVNEPDANSSGLLEGPIEGVVEGAIKGKFENVIVIVSPE